MSDLDNLLLVTRWLADAHDYPTVCPLPVAQPIRAYGFIVTFWRYLPQDVGPAPTSRDLGVLLKRLHDLPPPPIPLPTHQPLRSVRRAIELSKAITEVERQWLDARCQNLLSAHNQLDFELPRGMVHGDAWLGNVLRGHRSTVLADWDSVCIAPREIDYIPTLHASVRFGLPREQRESFIRAIGHDLTAWPGYSTLLAVRELSTLTALLYNAQKDERSMLELILQRHLHPDL